MSKIEFVNGSVIETGEFDSENVRSKVKGYEIVVGEDDEIKEDSEEDLYEQYIRYS